MINVLGWYEILYSVGINLGPSLPVLFSFVNIQIGWWRINENNIIPLIIATSVFIIFIVSWFHVIDLSKELDSIKAEFVLVEEKDEASKSPSVSNNEQSLLKPVEESSPDPEELENSSKSLSENRHLLKRAESLPEPKRDLMKWKDLLQFDILLLSFSYAFMGCTVTISVTDVSLISITTFRWKIVTLSWLHMIVGSSSYLIITLLVKLKFFKGRRTIFYSYVVAMCIALVGLSIKMLPQAIDFPNLSSQIALGGSILFLKCFVYFQAQSSGKFLVFNTVSFDNANFVDGFRSLVGNFFRLCARATMFYFFLYPGFFVPPVFAVGLLIIVLLLKRRRIHVNRSSPTQL